MVTVVEDSLLTDGTEQDLFEFLTTDFHGGTLFLDAMLASHTLIIKEFEKPDSGSAFVVGPAITISGVQTDKLRRFPISPHSAAWKITIELTTGANITLKFKTFVP